jgi:polysaccharide biosynthesis protein PelE
MINKKPLNISRFFYYWILAGILEFPFLLALMQNPYFLERKFSLTVSAHLLACITIFFSLPKDKGWFHFLRAWPKVFSYFVFFLPVFGWIFVLGIYLSYCTPKEPDAIFDEDVTFQDKVFELVSKQDTSSKEDKINRSLDFLPWADILNGDDIDLKRGAIEQLAKLATPEAIEILLHHRSDDSPEVRFYVTSALTRLKKSFDEELEAAKIQMQENVYMIDARILLAKIYINYARSHLLDEATEKSYNKEAVYHLMYAIDTDPKLSESYWLLLDLYRQEERWINALDLVKQIEKNGIATTDQIIKFRVELYYHTHRYDLLINEFKKMKDIPNVENEWKKLSFWWGVT